jgi:Ser/Thr protein kinase RdoA (MazF antagonist)
MLDVDSATGYLLDHGLIDAGAIVDGELTVVSAARRHRNLRVDGPAGTGYLLKQADALAEAGRETLRNEAAFYAFCREEPAAAPVARLLPRLVRFDPDPPLLALELVRGSAPLGERLAAPGGQPLVTAPARAAGAALATAHRTFRGLEPAGGARLGWLPRRPPWVMMIHKPDPELLTTIGPAAYRLLGILQTHDGFAPRLDRLREQWRPDTVIHNDVRSENVLVASPAGGGEPGPGDVTLVDWEMVQLGDPAWDVAGLLQDLVLFWVNSMPLAEGLDVEELAARARHPWPEVQGALRAFWHGYREAAGLAPADAELLLSRAVAFSAARLIQTAYEWAQPAHALPAQAVLLLQVSANVLEDPREARGRFYGIPQAFQV